MNLTTRPIGAEDAEALADLLRVNREFLAPWEPTRDDDYFTTEGQSKVIEAVLTKPDQVAHVIVDGERIVGRVTLNEIVRGPFQSCRMAGPPPLPAPGEVRGVT